ncbi:unnamed protein product [Durusdinium trenchii]|uniref:Uncharacterized protein n=1 Tax=Durusdinium trenchii TaxID=1381693 RepID=A0ABP0IMG3_9DINO
MDAGRVYFEDGTGLDISKSMSFKNLDRQGKATRCLQGSSTGAFQCGEYNNPKAHAGLRLMQEEQRLMTQKDPVAEILHYKTSGFAWALIAIATHFAFNLLCVAGGVLCTH